jgi:ribosomal protein S18 acetylase RimI-like enzyme
MLIRRLTPDDVIPFQRLRRERLEQDPRAFGESIAELEAVPLSILAKRLAASDDNFVMGAFTPEGELCGMSGFARNTRIKSRHKGLIWGVYVGPHFRGKGVGRAILTELLSQTRQLDGLEQIMLTVAIDQSAARELYRSLGFEAFGHERHALKVDGSYVDEDHLVLWLR